MEIERGRTGGYPANAVRVCIDRYSDYDVEGRMYSKLIEDPLLFRNCGEMLLKADYLFDEKGYPQTFQQKRCFREDRRVSRHLPPKIFVNDEAILGQSGDFTTFDVIVRSRKKSSWQGILRSGDGSASTEFNSEMELLKWIWNVVLNNRVVNSC